MTAPLESVFGAVAILVESIQSHQITTPKMTTVSAPAPMFLHIETSRKPMRLLVSVALTSELAIPIPFSGIAACSQTQLFMARPGIIRRASSDRRARHDQHNDASRPFIWTPEHPFRQGQAT